MASSQVLRFQFLVQHHAHALHHSQILIHLLYVHDAASYILYLHLTAINLTLSLLFMPLHVQWPW